MPKCSDAEHNYQKFDDATVVCTKCADQRVVDVAALIARFPQPIYLPCPGPHYPAPVYPTWYPNTTQPTIIYTSGTGDYFPPDSITIS